MVIEMMVLDKEADVEVNQEVDKEVTMVVEVDKELVNEGLALVCRYGALVLITVLLILDFTV